MQKVNVSQARPMAAWCLIAAALVLLVIGIGAAVFFMPARGGGIDKRPAPTSLTP